MYTAIALRANLATNTEVHGNEPAKIYFSCIRMRYDDVPEPTLIQYPNRVIDENNKLRDTMMFIPDYCILHQLAEEFRQLYTTRPSDAGFSKLIQTLNTLKLSHDWKTGNATPVPTRLLVDMRIAFGTYDTHHESVKVHRDKEINAHAMLVKKVGDLETALKAVQLAGPASDKSKRTTTSTFPVSNAAHPEIFSGPGHAEKGGVNRFGKPYNDDD